VYKAVLGQKINKERTALFFSKSIKTEAKDSIKGMLGVQEIKFYEKYLGLPSLVGRVTKLASVTLKSVFGEDCKGGRVSYYHKQGERSSLK